MVGVWSGQDPGRDKYGGFLILAFIGRTSNSRLGGTEMGWDTGHATYSTVLSLWFLSAWVGIQGVSAEVYFGTCAVQYNWHPGIIFQFVETTSTGTVGAGSLKLQRLRWFENSYSLLAACRTAFASLVRYSVPGSVTPCRQRSLTLSYSITVFVMSHEVIINN